MALTCCAVSRTIPQLRNNKVPRNGTNIGWITVASSSHSVFSQTDKHVKIYLTEVTSGFCPTKKLCVCFRLSSSLFESFQHLQSEFFWKVVLCWRNFNRSAKRHLSLLTVYKDGWHGLQYSCEWKRGASRTITLISTVWNKLHDVGLIFRCAPGS